MTPRYSDRVNAESLGILRRGWMDAASTLAPHVSGLPELLTARLEELTASGDLDEPHLMPVVDQAAQLAVDAGSAEVSHSLATRLRRTIYEYLLSLDAAVDAGTAEENGHIQEPPTGPLIGAEEVLTDRKVTPDEAEPEPDAPGERERKGKRFGFLGRASVASTPSGPSGTAVFEADDSADPAAAEPLPAEAVAADAAAEPDAAMPVAPRSGFHIGDPSDFVAQAPSSDASAAAEAAASAEDDDADAATAFSDPSTWPSAPPSRAPLPEFAEMERPAPPPPPVAAPAMSLPPLTSDAGTDAEPALGQAQRPARWSASWPGGEPVADATEPPLRRGWATRERPDPASAAAPAPPPSPAPAAPADASPPAAPAAVVASLPADSDGEESGLLGAEDVPEADLSEARIAIEEKLRKKRCDDAAALLQSLAQEVGGRPVAELALDAGDRCRGLGKANAALNCYLAASRADPVYETPLARLADICIDDQDIDLAVSYLERIARLMRLRSDNKGALRIYRKIATVAPYRDDILELLMRAQTTGRLDS
jgi:hypothetical protein